MKYVNAKAVLPHHLVEELQEYIQAGYIYIPAREDRHNCISEVNHGEPQCAAPFFGRFEWRISG